MSSTELGYNDVDAVGQKLRWLVTIQIFIEEFRRQVSVAYTPVEISYTQKNTALGILFRLRRTEENGSPEPGLQMAVVLPREPAACANQTHAGYRQKAET